MEIDSEIGTIGITSTIPIEVPLAAGINVFDMNNRFITNPKPMELVHQAERAGLSFNLCGWVKGLFAMGMSNIFDKIVVVDSGDCADLVALADFWEDAGIEILYFNYPTSREYIAMKSALKHFMKYFEITMEELKRTKSQLDEIRIKLHELDRLTWQEGKVSGPHSRIRMLPGLVSLVCRP
jgi:benzoyl-CoA reductase/2-hydroxyglutaryl-CoA dehydratase subunit BcrC/BadD/HgdB